MREKNTKEGGEKLIEKLVVSLCDRYMSELIFWSLALSR